MDNCHDEDPETAQLAAAFVVANRPEISSLPDASLDTPGKIQFWTEKIVRRANGISADIQFRYSPISSDGQCFYFHFTLARLLHQVWYSRHAHSSGFSPEFLESSRSQMADNGNTQDLDVQEALHLQCAIVQVCLRDAHIVMRNPQDTASSCSGAT
eukprot:5039795-Pleurochrysis_carterae.AAC.2